MFRKGTNFSKIWNHSQMERNCALHVWVGEILFPIMLGEVSLVQMMWWKRGIGWCIGTDTRILSMDQPWLAIRESSSPTQTGNAPGFFFEEAKLTPSNWHQRESNLRPWGGNAPGYSIYVSELIDQATKTWKGFLVCHLFDPHTTNLIMKTPFFFLSY